MIAKAVSELFMKGMMGNYKSSFRIAIAASFVYGYLLIGIIDILYTPGRIVATGQELGTSG